MEKKNIRMWPAEKDGDMIWFSDTLAGGLYRYNTVTREIKCEITPVELHKYHIFRIGGIVRWREHIVICPIYLKNFVAVYTPNMHCIRIISIIGMESYDQVDGAREIRKKLYLNFYNSRIAALIIDIEKLCDYKTNEIVSQVIYYPDNKMHVAWFAKCFGEAIYLPIYKEKIIYKVEKDCISSILLEIPQTICTISFCGSELWILSADGREIYRVDLNGRVQESILINYDIFPFDVGLGHNIIASEQFVFFMFWNNVMGCYDRKKKCIIDLKLKFEDINKQYMDEELAGVFLWNMEKDKKLLFFPYRNRGVEIDLLRFECKFFDIYYPEDIKENCVIYWHEIAFAHKEANQFLELRSKTLRSYIKFMYPTNKLYTFASHSMLPVGERLYQSVSQK